MIDYPKPIYVHGHLKREELPEVVQRSLETWAGRNKVPSNAVFHSLRWDSMNGCYCFTWKGCFYGVEKADGYIHT
jgi:hypothetical protein